jgi:hypothetical protein
MVYSDGSACRPFRSSHLREGIPSELYWLQPLPATGRPAAALPTSTLSFLILSLTLPLTCHLIPRAETSIKIAIALPSPYPIIFMGILYYLAHISIVNGSLCFPNAEDSITISPQPTPTKRPLFFTPNLKASASNLSPPSPNLIKKMPKRCIPCFHAAKN